MKIQKATKKEFKSIVNLALKLWPNHSRNQLEKEFLEIFRKKNEVIFIAIIPSDKVVGFATASIKKNNVPGVKFYPVGYVEGIYVKPEFRKKDIAKKLVKEVEKWSKLNKCKILASDVELKNVTSQIFHKKIGFKESDRLVFFEKQLK